MSDIDFTEWNKAFDKLRYKHETWMIFQDFLDMTVDQFTIPGMKPLFHHKDRYTKKEYEYFGELFNAYIQGMYVELEKRPYCDFLGEWWESDVNMTNKFRAQFFTPMSICELMVDLTIQNDSELSEDPVVMHDSCCGTSRFGLVYHDRRPQDFFMFGDLDDYAVKMSLLNMIFHGMRGVVAHMNTLTLEVFQCWQVTPYLAGLPYIVPYGTDLQGAKACLPRNKTRQAPSEIDKEILTIQKGKQKGALDKWLN